MWYWRSILSTHVHLFHAHQTIIALFSDILVLQPQRSQRKTICNRAAAQGFTCIFGYFCCHGCFSGHWRAWAQKETCSEIMSESTPQRHLEFTIRTNYTFFVTLEINFCATLLRDIYFAVSQLHDCSMLAKKPVYLAPGLIVLNRFITYFAFT